MTKSVRRLAIGALAFLVPLAAGADVFLNGVNITGVRGQTFEKATVRIDAQGNIHIDAKGYAVSGGSGGAAPSTGTTPIRAGRITGRYFLVTSQNVVGASQYDIDFYVNAKWIRKLRSEQEQIVVDITRYLRPGRNKVLLMAHKKMGAERKSHSQSHYFRVLIGEGAEGGNNIMIEKSLIDFRVNAAQVEDFSREYTVDVR